MTIEVKFVQHDDYLEEVATGTYDMEEAIDRFPLVLSACRMAGMTKVLIDFRELAGVPTSTEKSIYAHGVDEHYKLYLSSGGVPLRIAFVGSSPHVNCFYEPGLEVARQAELPVELFTEIEDALAWLGVETKA